ncbi:MFS transporter [Micromonospora sp. bgisy143]|uniref:MFS transporter n=1 Tax=Micromonospora sp. bgisy143 TaxID=3413790 RepID=UPI003EBC1DFE
MTTTAPPTTAPATPSLWRHRDFMTLWTGQTLSETGSAVSTLAVPLIAVSVLNASTFSVSLLQAAGMAAYLLVALPAGVIVDRMRKRRLMVLCNLLRAVAMATIPVAFFAGQLTMAQLWLVAALCSVCSVFFEVAYQCYLPTVVRSDQLLDANGKLSTTYSVAQVAGIGLGGGLVALFGAARTVLIDAASFAVSAVSLLLIRRSEPELTAPEGPRPRLREEISAGLAFAFRHPVLRKIVAASGTLNVFSQVIYALSVIYLVRVLKLTPAEVAVQLALGTAGGIAGGLASGRLARRVGTARIIWVSLLGLGWTMLLVPLAEPGWRVAFYTVGMTGFAALCAIYNAAQISYRQQMCPPELLGRLTAGVRWIVWGALPIGAVLGGALGTWLGVRETLVIAALGVWASGLWVYFSPLRGMRDFAPTPEQAHQP